MSVDVYFVKIGEGLHPALDNVAEILNNTDKKREEAFHRAEDKYRFLAGRWLLQQWLCDNGLLTRLDAITLDGYKRPVLDGISFSISHSGDWAALAATAGNEKMGLDIEQNNIMPVQDYMLPFTQAEQHYILAEDSVNRFYCLWTRKEAVLKAMGQGFLSEPANTEVLDNIVMVEGKHLHIHRLHTCEGYTIHIATETADVNTIKITMKG